MEAIDRAVEAHRDRDTERHHADGEDAPLIHTAESWADGAADALLGDDEIVEHLRVLLSRALYWLHEPPDDSPEHLLWYMQVAQERVNRIGNLIVKAALKSGLTHQQMGVDE